MEWWWTRGVERSKTKRGCRTFFNLHVLDQKWSKYLEFAFAKLRGLCKYLANVYNYNSHSHVYGLHCLTLVNENKAENQCNEASRPSKKSSALSHTKYGEVSLQIEFATLPPKPQPLYEMKMKGKLEEQGKCSQANSTWYNTQGWDMKRRGGAWSEETVGGEGGSFVSTYKRAGRNGMTIHILSNSY